METVCSLIGIKVPLDLEEWCDITLKEKYRDDWVLVFEKVDQTDGETVLLCKVLLKGSKAEKVYGHDLPWGA